VLQDKEYYKVGSIKPSSADVRIIAATNRDLDKMVENETFRQDLYYRLHVIPIAVPPLRERKQDIPVLIAYFCKRLSEKFGIMKEIDPEVIDHLYNYDWPGNVRELESLIERMLITVPERYITLSALPKPYSINTSSNARTLKERVEQFELELVRAELEQARDKDEAAKNLGISVSSLFRKIKLLGS
jgi:transcriptional regulator with PAS, ATPase and Fis domain